MHNATRWCSTLSFLHLATECIPLQGGNSTDKVIKILHKKSPRELMLKNVPRFPRRPVSLSFYLRDFRNSYQKTVKFRVLLPTIFFIKYFRRR